VAVGQAEQVVFGCVGVVAHGIGESWLAKVASFDATFPARCARR